MSPCAVPQVSENSLHMEDDHQTIIRLISHEGQEFLVEKDVVTQSCTLAMFLDPELGFIE